MLFDTSTARCGPVECPTKEVWYPLSTSCYRSDRRMDGGPPLKRQRQFSFPGLEADGSFQEADEVYDGLSEELGVDPNEDFTGELDFPEDPVFPEDYQIQEGDVTLKENPVQLTVVEASRGSAGSLEIPASIDLSLSPGFPADSAPDTSIPPLPLTSPFAMLAEEDHEVTMALNIEAFQFNFVFDAERVTLNHNFWS